MGEEKVHFDDRIDLDGILRVDVEKLLTFNRKTGALTFHWAATVKVQGANGRWRKAMPGPLLAFESGYFETRAQVFESLARIVANWDGCHPEATEEEGPNGES